MKDVIEIPLSKKKIFLLLVGAIVFVVAGIFFTLYPETFQSTRYRNPEFIRIAGIASIIFFGACAVYASVKIFDKKTGLTINDDGIIDNSSGTSVGLIEWEDIEGFETINIAGTKILMIKTNKPEKYINQASNMFSKQALKTSLKLYGSPLSIASNSLDIRFNELEEIIIKKFKNRNYVDSQAFIYHL